MSNVETDKVQERELNLQAEKKEIGERIIRRLVECRKSKGMSQQNVADKIGMKRANVARIESMRYTPSLEGMMRYASAVGLKVKVELVEAEED